MKWPIVNGYLCKFRASKNSLYPSLPIPIGMKKGEGNKDNVFIDALHAIFGLDL